MKSRRLITLCLATVFAIGATSSQAIDIGYNFEKATPIGSWQIREESLTDHKGKQRVAVLKTALVGKEDRDGETCYWFEIETSNFKVKKDKRKADGDRAIMKVLVAKSAIGSDFANVFKNLRNMAKEIIVQTGDSDPILISGGGMLAESMMQASGTQMKYDFTVTGNETVSVPAGSFKSKKIEGKGTTEMKVVFKTIKVDSQSTVWISNEMPFGIVKSESRNTVNGKPETASSLVIEYGRSGATTQITKTPQAMPQMPDMFGTGGRKGY